MTTATLNTPHRLPPTPLRRVDVPEGYINVGGTVWRKENWKNRQTKIMRLTAIREGRPAERMPAIGVHAHRRTQRQKREARMRANQWG